MPRIGSLHKNAASLPPFCRFPCLLSDACSETLFTDFCTLRLVKPDILWYTYGVIKKKGGLHVLPMLETKVFLEKVKEAAASVLPITLIVTLLCLVFVPVRNGLLLSFLLGSLLLVIGMGLFTLGAEMAMSRIGSSIGAKLTRSRKLWLIILVSFLLGTAISMAEPDLQVLAESVPAIDTTVLILTVSVGVGLFLSLCMLRILFSISLRTLLLIVYGLAFVLVLIIPSAMDSVTFDAGGVTTGPMTVPFIMALGVGVASIRSDENAKADSFGLVALCSVGPILAVEVLSLFYPVSSIPVDLFEPPELANTVALGWTYVGELPTYMKEMAVSLLPIFAFFLIFQVLSLRLQPVPLLRILFGILHTYVGLVLFLTGVNVGFSPLGTVLGVALADSAFTWLLVPLAMLMGWFIINAEPAVHVLNRQVEELSAGAISAKAMGLSLSIAVAAANGLAMLRVLTGISLLYFVIPGYVLALGMSFFVPRTFTAIAFDSGGVASGPLTATFMLPMAIGACEQLGGVSMTDAFGLVALVAMMPLITVQFMGLLFVLKSRRAKPAPAVHSYADNEIIELWEAV